MPKSLIVEACYPAKPVMWEVTFTYSLEVEAEDRKEAINLAQSIAQEDMSIYDCEAIARKLDDEEDA